MTRKFRLTLAAVAASAALLGGGVTTPVAAASPSDESGAAKRALDSISAQPTDAADAISGMQAANELLKALGITPFTPTMGACTDFTFPTAIGGAMPGPTTPIIGPIDVPLLPDVDLNAIREGEILYGFVPVGTFDDSDDKSGMQVAWFNVNTFEGGLGEPMGGMADVILDAVTERLDGAGVPDLISGPALEQLEGVLDDVPSNGVRGGIVETGQGAVLSAIYGSVQKGDATCYFFPSVGIATAK